MYVAPDQDPVLDYITAAIQNNDTGDQVEATYTGYNALYQAMYQTYGRKVNLKFLRGSGQSTDAVAARADAVKAAEEMGAFAVWGGPVLTRAWTDELNARGVVCLGCFASTRRSPTCSPSERRPTRAAISSPSTSASAWRTSRRKFAGDPAFQTENRVFGHLFITTTGGTEQQNADKLRDKLERGRA